MPRIEQTIVNRQDKPIYVSVEPWPECFELEPDDKLTLIWESDAGNETAQIDFVNESELVIWPNGETDKMRYLINGEEAEERSWVFKHR